MIHNYLITVSSLSGPTEIIETGMPVYLSEDALSCVAMGTGKAVENVDLYKKGFIASRRS